MYDNEENPLNFLPESILNLNYLKKLILEGKGGLNNLPNWIGEVSSLEELNIQSCGLKSIPSSICKLHSLIKLNLSYNKLSSLPESMSDLSSLEVLNLSGNNINHLPDFIGDLVSLQKLDISSFGLSILPEVIGNLHSLHTLDLMSNKLTLLPEAIGNLRSLKKLILRHNRLIKLPESIGKLKDLKVLDLDYNNKLEFLPDSIGELKSLEVLKSIESALINLPDSFVNLSSLKELELSNNQIRSLPNHFGALQSLKKLDLFNNNIKTLPDSLGLLENLELVNFVANPLQGEFEKLAPRYNSRKSNIDCLEFIRKRNAINIFISYAFDDFKTFEIDKISNFLEEQQEINKAFYFTEDQEKKFVEKTLLASNLLLFFSSRNSIEKSPECLKEIEFANKIYLQIIPILGDNYKWENLAKINLSRVLGFEFDKSNLNHFMKRLYLHVHRLKREINLFDRDKGKLDKELFKLKKNFSILFESEQFHLKIRENYKKIENVVDKFKLNEIKISQLIKHLLMLIFG